jgi:TRAP transporter TAXI family solute receptor
MNGINMKVTAGGLHFACALSIGLLALITPAAAQNAGSQSFTVATASPGGPYLAYGQGLARILSRELKREVTAQATQGPAQNIVLLERKEVTLAFITMGVGLQAWKGADWAKGTQHRSMRVLFPMYDTAFQFVAPQRLKITWLNDLAGLRIGVGPKAGTGGAYVPEMFKALDLSANIRYGAWEAMQTQLKDGALDGVTFVGGVPFPALAELEKSAPIDFIQPSSDQIAAIRKQLPEMSPSTIATGSYSSLKNNYETVGLFNFAVAHKDLPDDLAYAIVKAVFQNNADLVKAQASAKETIAANIGRNTLLPLHPGAERYYRELGIKIPSPVVN